MNAQDRTSENNLARALRTRPLNVVQASLLQVATGIMTAVTTMNGYDHYVEMAAVLGRDAGTFEQFLLSRGANVLVTLLFAWLFYQGKNWARLLFVAFFSINMVFILWSLSILGLSRFTETIASLDSVISLLQVVISLSICCLLMTTASRRWFQDVKEARARDKEEASKDESA